MDRIRKQVWEGDLAELKASGKGYMPTAFPGFSWDNLRRTPPGTTMIPRRKGEFYWRQFAIFRELGIRTVFVGMFDEVDEGTAIYKVADKTPVGKYFVTYEGLPTDWYLKLTGAATRMIRGDAPLSEKIPDELPLPQRLTKAQRHERRHRPPRTSGARRDPGRRDPREPSRHEGGGVPPPSRARRPPGTTGSTATTS